jgi:hypothetical protein
MDGMQKIIGKIRGSWIAAQYFQPKLVGWSFHQPDRKLLKGTGRPTVFCLLSSNLNMNGWKTEGALL